MNLRSIYHIIQDFIGQSRLKTQKEDIKPEMTSVSYSDLAPTTDCDQQSVYCNALNWALQNPRIQNIALSGSYGSGKSSVLKKFREQSEVKNRCIDISLASLSKISEDTSKKDDTSQKELIEMSILQQIFYCERAYRIPDSRFRRIRSLTCRKLFLWAIGLTLWILICQAPLWFPEIHPQEKLWGFVGWLIVLGLGIGHLSAKLLRTINRNKVSRLNIKNGEIELSKGTDPSILNKYLDELLYFFEVTKYNVVIIEDLDRFENPDIFTKLREINLLLNNSRQIKQHIVFIYALRDDLFQDKNRTKFFDFIIPIIPVINPTNASDVLNRKLSGTGLSSHLIDDISLYIDDMRLLKNICNEYFIYKRNLSEELNQDKIFALIVYKNLFPEDFVALHVRRGMVARAFEQTPEWAQFHVEQIDERLAELEQQREKLFVTSNDRKLVDIKQEIARLESEKVQVPSWSLQQLLEKNEDIRLFEKKEEMPNADLIVYLLRYGYIAEDYQYYISLFHEGRITRSDYKYLLSVKNRRPLSFDHPLKHIENLLPRLRPTEFGDKVILNDSMTDYLLTKCSTQDERAARYFEQLSNKSDTSLRYIDYYLTGGSRKPEFVARLAKDWPQWWDFVTEHVELYSDHTLKSWLRLLAQHAEMKDIIIQDINHSISQYILGRRDFLTWVTSVNNNDKIKRIIDLLKIRFTALDAPEKPSLILDHIYENGCYELTPEMIALFVQTKGKDVRVEDLQTANYSTILASGCEQLIDRIEEDIKTYIDQVFSPLEMNTQEASETVVRLLNNKGVTGKQKTAIIRKEVVRLEDITAVSDQTLWSELLHKDRMQPTWSNVVVYYEYAEKVFDDNLIEFLNRSENYTELSLTKFDEGIEMEEETKELLSLAILRNDALDKDSYIALLNSIPPAYSQWDNISIKGLAAEKIDVLVKSGFLALTMENYNSLKEHFAPKHIAFLEYHATQFDSCITLFEFDRADIQQLVQSKAFNLSQKIQLIRSVDESLISEQEETCIVLGQLLYEARDRSNMSVTLLASLIRYSSNPEQKIKLLLWHWESIENEEHITTLLKACGASHSKLTQKGKRPVLQRTSYNYSLAEKLKAVGYISSYSEEEKAIRVNTKQR